MLYFMERPIYKWMITGGRPYRKAPFEYSTWGCSCNHHWIHYIYKIVIRALSQLMRVNTIVIPEKLSQSCTPKQEQIRSSQFLFRGHFQTENQTATSHHFFSICGKTSWKLISTRNFRTWAKHFLLFCRTLLHPNGEKTHRFLAKKILKNSVFHR